MVCPDFPEVRVNATDIRPSTLPSPFKYKVTVTEQAGVDLTDYQVLLKVENDSDFFAAFNNDHKYMEVYDEDKSTLLKFWVEEWDTTNFNAKIWIKVPSIPANGTRTLYLKYNESRTEPLSNAPDTFLVFDDFERSTINGGKYTYVLWDRRNNTEASEQDASPGGVIENGQLKLWDDTMAYIAQAFPANIAIKVRTRHTGTRTTRRSVFGARYQNTSGNPGDGVGFGLVYSGDSYKTAGRYVLDPHSGLWGTEVVADTSLAPPNNEWIELEIRLYQGTGKFYYQGELWQTVSGLSVRDGPVAMMASYDYHYFDDLIVRKFVDPEPTVSYSKL